MAGEAGGGLFCQGWIKETTNSIFWENRAPVGSEIGGPPGALPVSFSLVKGGWFGLGNLNENPGFVDPENDDYHHGISILISRFISPASCAYQGSLVLKGIVATTRA